MSDYMKRAQKAMKDGKSENLSPKYVEFKNQGDAIAGMYLDRHEVLSAQSDKTYYQYLFDSDQGLIKFHLGSATDNEAGSLMIKGDIYYIEFLGKESIGGGKTVNKFHVEKITDETECEDEL